MKGRSTKVWLGILCLLLVVGIAGIFFVHSAREPGGLVRITWNDTLQGTYPLSEDQTLTYESNSGQCNRVTIRGGVVFMEEANCPDQICVHHAPTDQTADPIVCLPNRLVVEVIPAQ
ncbi:MAG: NusG domain II-containing protein [Ruminiclostridium sp.]|nr:NusG domain II-containing protein [Ruminiclostridium sp.]